ncbi:MAG TPA: serine hydrolase domain-containing protein, partial [Sphingomonadaceae bacterium]|nr:serine hydrolase domain-containing protein [Sphingomonadaceae bacterium]
MGVRGKSGLCADRLQHLREVIEQDIATGLYTGAAIGVSRHGETGLLDAFGNYSSKDDRQISTDSVFSLFSLTKAFTNVLILRAVERGQLALTTKVVEIIPEFRGLPREHIRLDHLLTHRTGLPSVFAPVPGMPIDRLDVMIEAICKHVHGQEEPGGRVAYSPCVAHALMGEMLRRTDPAGRSYREIVHQDLFEPLGMTSSGIGVR